jgi:hypothetical protein
MTNTTKKLFQNLIATREFSIVDGQSDTGAYFLFAARGLSSGYLIFVDNENGNEIFEDLT